LREARRWSDLGDAPYGLSPVILLAIIGFFQNADTTALPIAAPTIARDLGISITGVVRILQFVGGMAVLGVVFAAYYFDRHRRARAVGYLTIISGLGSMLTGAAKSALSLGLPRTIDDATNLSANVPVASLLSDYYPPETRGRVFAVLGTLTSIGLVVSSLTAGAIVAWVGWRAAWLIFGIPLVLSGVIVVVFLRDPVRGYMERRQLGADEDDACQEEEPLSFGESWRAVWAVRTIRRLFLSEMWVNGAVVTFLSLFNFFLAEQYGLTVFQRTLVLVPATIALVGGAYLGGGLIDVLTRRSPGRVLALVGGFVSIAAVGQLIIAFEPPLAIVVLTTAMVYFGFALSGPALGAIYSQVSPPQVRTLALSVSQLSRLPALLFVLPVADALRIRDGFTAAMLVPVPLLVIGGVIAASAAPFYDIDRRNATARAAATEDWRRAREAAAGNVLVCRSVDVAYDGVQVLFGVDLDVGDGEIVALLGTNGAGKSTLLRAISGTQEASGGAIVLDGRDITHMPPHELAARGVVQMPGGRGVFPRLTVTEHLQLARWTGRAGEAFDELLAEVHELFPILRQRAAEQARVLSGGEQQMLSLAQALLSRPRLLMIDELSLGLSPAVVGQLLEAVRRIHARGTTIIVVEQSVNVALTIAERAVFMEKGEVRFVGPTAELLARPDILRAVYVKGTGPSGAAMPAAARSRRVGPPSSVRPILEVSGVVKRFGGVVALRGVDLALDDGQVLGLIGPNGSGKTTLFDVISGFQSPDEGTVVLDGVDVTAERPDQRAERKLIRRFQDARLFGSLTVLETILVALDQTLELKNTLLLAAQVRAVRDSERRARRRADALIHMLALEPYRDSFVRELSTGVRRIVDLAFVLASEPRVLLLDEPSSGIAQAECESLVPLLRRVRHETGCSMLVIEHDMPLITSIADELVALDQGEVVVRGSADEVLEDERVVSSYLGGDEATVRRSGGLA
jgi:branched-chain amino acid transport system ATP-binding protein